MPQVSASPDSDINLKTRKIPGKDTGSFGWNELTVIIM